MIRPGSFLRLAAAGRARDVGGLPPLVWLLGAFVMFLAPVPGLVLVEALPGSALGAHDSQPRRAAGQIASYITAALIGGIMVWLLSARADRSGGRSGLRVRLGDAPRGLLGLGLTIPFYAVAAAASLWAMHLLGRPTNPVAHKALEPIASGNATVWDWAIIGAAVLGAPIAEELIFRVFLQSFFASVPRMLDGGDGPTRGQGTWIAIAFSAALFAAMHVGTSASDGPVPYYALPGLFVLGLGLGTAYERTGRLGVPIVMHALFNAGNVVLAVVSA